MSFADMAPPDPFPFSKEEIDHLKKTISRVYHNKGDKAWQSAFRRYNAHNEKQLDMSCAPCYVKVFRWAIFWSEEKVADRQKKIDVRMAYRQELKNVMTNESRGNSR